MINEIDDITRGDLFEYLLRLGDDRLILGHRLSEWCGHAPMLEEDIALANIALDCLGQANAFLSLAGEVENKGRTEDTLAYFREAVDFRNVKLVEQPNTDFAYTIVRQFFIDVFAFHLYETLSGSEYKPLAAIAEKSLKEVKYHIRHSSEWVLRLGDGTEESHNKTQNAVDNLWQYTNELFEEDSINKRLTQTGIAVNLNYIKEKWNLQVERILQKATLKIPERTYLIGGGRTGNHSEHLGHLLAEMQIVARSFPDATW